MAELNSYDTAVSENEADEAVGMPVGDDDPSTLGLAQIRMKKSLTVCRDCYEGPLTIRDAGQTYLPRFPLETADAYEDRRKNSTFYDVFSRSINGLTGMVFRDSPQLADDLPQKIKDRWENIDMLGTHGDVFARQRHIDGEVDGFFLIFVDMQEFDEEATPSRGAENQSGKRAYWIPITAQNVIAAETQEVDGVVMLTHFRYKSCVIVRKGKYTQKLQESVREYNLVNVIGPDGATRKVEYKVWIKNDETKMWRRDSYGLMEIDEIPLSVAYFGEKKAELEVRTPHLSLALENIKHYQLVSDNDNVLHLCSVPIFVRIGFVSGKPGEEQGVGPNLGIDVPQGGDVKYAEPGGHGLAAAERRINKSEYRMAMLGLSMLMSQHHVEETATAKKIDKAESDSALAFHARATQDALENALRLTAKWEDLELPAQTEDRRWIHINKDFESLGIDPQTADVLATMVENNKLTQETLWSILQRSKVLPSTFDPVTEAEKLDKIEKEELKQQQEMMDKQAEIAKANQPAPGAAPNAPPGAKNVNVRIQRGAPKAKEPKAKPAPTEA